VQVARLHWSWLGCGVTRRGTERWLRGFVRRPSSPPPLRAALAGARLRTSRAYLAGWIDRERDAADAGDAAAGFDFGDAVRMAAEFVRSPPSVLACLAEPRPGSAASHSPGATCGFGGGARRGPGVGVPSPPPPSLARGAGQMIIHDVHHIYTITSRSETVPDLNFKMIIIECACEVRRGTNVSWELDA
jgi:hypothetical protein